MSKKKPLRMMFDGLSHKPVIVIARVAGCALLVGLKNRALSERRMNKVARAIRAVCKKRGVDRVKLGSEIIRLGRKVRGTIRWLQD
jgi:hypothetical protein